MQTLSCQDQWLQHVFEGVTLFTFFIRCFLAQWMIHLGMLRSEAMMPKLKVNNYLYGLLDGWCTVERWDGPRISHFQSFGTGSDFVLDDYGAMVCGNHDNESNLKKARCINTIEGVLYDNYIHYVLSRKQNTKLWIYERNVSSFSREFFPLYCK